jgi:serine/threonine-protein kinase
MAAPALKVGTVLAGKLRVEQMIGRGAMGIVLKCTDTKLDRLVAVKIMTPGEAKDDELRTRFLREAHAASSLASEHMTRVLEVGELDDGTPFFVMELLEGTLLETVIEKDGPAPVDVAIDWMVQAIDVIAEAHLRGLVHRDLKPANLFLAERPNGPPIIKVLDFGVVKNILGPATGGRELTATGAVLGTPAYMAPEQIRSGGAIDPRTDVWACGVTLFELLTGTVPFESASIPAMMSKILKEPAPSLKSVRPNVPDKLDAIVARCLAKDPSERFANGEDLGHALAALRAPSVRSVNAAALPNVAGDTPDAFAATLIDTSRARIELADLRRGDPPMARTRAQRSNTNALVAAAVLGALAIVLGIIAWMTRRPAEVAPTTPLSSSVVVAPPSAPPPPPSTKPTGQRPPSPPPTKRRH